jgi:vacuolar protein sorting-associated protein IST1
MPCEYILYRECPEDLKGVIATMLYVAPRCGDLPELQEIRTYLRSIYGDEFCTTAANIESQSNLVDRKVITI